jgi:hypothetical protein
LSNFEINYDQTTIFLDNLVGNITTDACIGLACNDVGGDVVDICSTFVLNGVCNNDSTCDTGNATCDDDLSACPNGDSDCLGDNTCFGSTQPCTVDANCDPLGSPRIMYDSGCDKLQFAACGDTPCAADTDCPFNSQTGQMCDFDTPCDSVALTCKNDSTITCTVANENTDCATAPNNECRNINFGTCGQIANNRCTNTNVDCSENGDDDCNFLFGDAACCAPFGIFPDVADVCKVRPVASADAPPCCDQSGLVTGSTRPDDFDCSGTAANQRRCCAALAESFPEATTAQQPQLPAN